MSFCIEDQDTFQFVFNILHSAQGLSSKDPIINPTRTCSKSTMEISLRYVKSSIFYLKMVSLIFLQYTAWKVSVFGVILVRIQAECGKIRTRITPNTDNFHAVVDKEFSSTIYSDILNVNTVFILPSNKFKYSLIEEPNKTNQFWKTIKWLRATSHTSLGKQLPKNAIGNETPR